VVKGVTLKVVVKREPVMFALFFLFSDADRSTSHTEMHINKILSSCRRRSEEKRFNMPRLA